MDTYVDKFQQNGGSMVMLAKGNRSKEVKEACKKYGGFYLGNMGCCYENSSRLYKKNLNIRVS